MEFDIFGSCVSRDGFEFESSSHKVNNYFSRSSLVSILQQPLSINNLEINLESNFLKRTVKDDLTKRFKKYVKNPRSKVIIVDLIQERYPLVQREGSWFTYSADYARAKLPKGKMIKELDHLKIYKENIDDIVFLFKEYDYVILHEANLVERYYDKNGSVKSFDLYDKDKYFIKNGHEYYNLLKEKLPNVYSLKIEGFKGTSGHKWGSAPSHFEAGYYDKFNQGLDFIIKNKQDYYYNHKRNKQSGGSVSDISLKEFLSDDSKIYGTLKVNSFDIIKLSNRSRHTNEVVRNAMNNKVIPFPKFESFSLNEISDWDTSNEKYGKSYQLYIHTLRFVNELLLQYDHTKEEKYINKAEKYLEQWIRYASKSKVSKMVWYDHSAAQRTQVLLYFVYLVQDRESFDKNKYGRLLEFHGIYLAEKATYHRTNHGLMMDRSLMTLGIVLENENLFNYGYFRSIDTFWYSFSAKGLHLENSPGYHNMVVKMYRQVEDFLNNNDKTYGNVINNTLDIADNLKGLITTPHGIMPNIGDTGNKIEQNKISYNNFVDYEGGLTIIQDQMKMLYSTFISGYSSITHKHYDDLSITLMFKGMKFLEEAGRYNYSRHAYRKYVKSQQAHSGVYVANETYSLKKENRFTRKVRTDFHLENDKIFHVKGTHEDYTKADLSRQVIYLKCESIIILLDKAISHDEVSIIHNFNLNKDVKISESKRGIYLLNNNDVEILLKCHSKMDGSEIIEGSTNENNVTAINSPDFNQIEKTKQIKFQNTLDSHSEKHSVFTLSEREIGEKISINLMIENSILEVKVNDNVYSFNI